MKTPFEVVYGRNPVTPLDLAPYATKDRESREGLDQAEKIKHIHEETRLQLER